VPLFIANKLKKHQVEGLRFIWQNWFESVDQVRASMRVLCCARAVVRCRAELTPSAMLYFRHPVPPPLPFAIR
jgi:hypothetical protein